MIKVVNVVYHHHKNYNTPKQALDKQNPAFGFVHFIDARLNIQLIKHLNYTGTQEKDGIAYAFFKSRNKFWWVPLATHRYIKKQQPDIVMIEGLLFPLQLLALKFLLKKKCSFIVRHHGENPFGGAKFFFQKLADKYIDAYLFTSYKNGSNWMDKVIKNPAKCVEVLEASTDFSKLNTAQSQSLTGITGCYNFLWVGRLITDKDPLTVLKAFEQYTLLQPTAKLYMIYQDGKLLKQVIRMIAKSTTLKQTVRLVGEVKNNELAAWYSAANFFISGSRREAAGYALLEAMACGCIPIVTSIPSFEKLTVNGKYGFLYPAGDANALANILISLSNINIDNYRIKVENHFKEHLSFKKIANELSELCIKLYSEQS